MKRERMGMCAVFGLGAGLFAALCGTVLMVWPGQYPESAARSAGSLFGYAIVFSLLGLAAAVKWIREVRRQWRAERAVAGADPRLG